MIDLSKYKEVVNFYEIININFSHVNNEKQEQQIIEKRVDYLNKVAKKYQMRIFKARGRYGNPVYFLGYVPPSSEFKAMNRPPPEAKFIYCQYPDGTEEIKMVQYGRLLSSAKIDYEMIEMRKRGEI